MQLYVIRHAQSTNNALVNPQDRVCDPTLTTLGVRQADILARHLADGTELVPEIRSRDGRDQPGFTFSRLFCSPMWRALQTADPIGRLLGLRPEVWVNIHEQGGIFLDHQDGRGPLGYPGKTRQDIRTAFPGFDLPDEVSEGGWWNRDYENWAACHQRAGRVARELRQWADDKLRGQYVAMISHGGFMDALLKALFNQSADRHLFYFHYNTAITRVDFRDDSRLDVHYLNRLDHLPPELAS